MPKQDRVKTRYPGVYYVVGERIDEPGSEKIFYIRYHKDGKLVEEKIGRQYKDDMTAAKASTLRGYRVRGKKLTNTEHRKAQQATKWTFTTLWRKYKAQNPHLKGIATDENRFEKHIEPAFGIKEPKDIAPLDIDRLRIKLLKTKKAGTVKNVLELVRRLINFGVKKRLCDGPGFIIELPNANNLRTEDLTQAQLGRLLDALDNEPNIQVANIMRMALFTGMRRGELFRLKWKHIDYDRGFILIKDPKGGKDQKIPLNDAARTALENHPRTESKYIFPGRGGNQRVDCNKQVNAIKKRAKLPEDFRALHGLRHVFASHLASSGEVDLYTLQKLLTHKKPEMTQRYAHLRDDSLKKASELAGQIGSGIGKGKKDQVARMRSRG